MKSAVHNASHAGADLAMIRRKIAIIVEPDFMRLHVGVRNYLFSLHATLSKKCRVDWVSFRRTGVGERRWFHLIPPVARVDAAARPTQPIVGTPAEVLRKAGDLKRQVPSTIAAEWWRSDIGSDLAVEEYDAIIISNPWLVDFESRLPASRVLGMAYDMVPNHYVFSSSDKPFCFAAQHRRGFIYYREHCDAVLAISPPVADEIAAAFDCDRVVALPPVLPPSYVSVAPAGNERPRSVALASPFDLRKGLRVMPDILNAARESIDTLSIYGSLRCTGQQAGDFFRGLRVRHVEWYPRASACTVHGIFLRAKAMLFPSFDEGLGLPILEAQYCGCRVMVRDKPPMINLAGPGSGVVPEDAAEAGAVLAGMMAEPFDHAALQKWAQTRFSLRHVQEVLGGVIEQSDGNHSAVVLPLPGQRFSQALRAEGVT